MDPSFFQCLNLQINQVEGVIAVCRYNEIAVPNLSCAGDQFHARKMHSWAGQRGRGSDRKKLRQFRSMESEYHPTTFNQKTALGPCNNLCAALYRSGGREYLEKALGRNSYLRSLKTPGMIQCNVIHSVLNNSKSVGTVVQLESAVGYRIGLPRF